MGVSLNTLNKSGDMGYFGFNRLRQRVAKLYDDGVYSEYMTLFDFNKDSVTQLSAEGMRLRLYENADAKGKAVIDFIFLSDCEGVIDWECAAHLLEVCNGAGEEERSDIYGYYAHRDAFTFGDFIDMLEDCVNENCPLWWW